MLDIARFLTHLDGWSDFNGMTDIDQGDPRICGISDSPPANYAKCFDPAFQDTTKAIAVAEL